MKRTRVRTGWSVCHVLFAVSLLAASAQAAAGSPGEAPARVAVEAPAPDAVVEWVRRKALPITDLTGARELAEVAKLTAGARVVALGEPAHGAEEILLWRNRLVRLLVEDHGFTAVALESGFAQSRRIDAYVLGGPGDAVQIVHDNLSWGFGELEANVELVRWLRDHNARHPLRQVHFYGADVTGGDGRPGLSRAQVALQDVIDYAARALPEGSERARASLQRFVTRFTPEDYAAYSPDDRSTLRAALLSADRLFEEKRVEMIAATTADDFAWAVEILRDVDRIEQMFRAWPGTDAGADRLAALIAVDSIRDRTMADHLLWALGREGPQGRIVSFAHDGHVASAAVLPTLPTGYTLPMPQGAHLRAALGTAYRVIITSAIGNGAGVPATTVPPGSLDRLLSAAAVGPYLVDIRDAPSPWWRAPQTLRADFGSTRNLVPASAADAVLFVPLLTAARRTEPVR